MSSGLFVKGKEAEKGTKKEAIVMDKMNECMVCQ